MERWQRHPRRTWKLAEKAHWEIYSSQQQDTIYLNDWTKYPKSLVCSRKNKNKSLEKYCGLVYNTAQPHQMHGPILLDKTDLTSPILTQEDTVEKLFKLKQCFIQSLSIKFHLLLVTSNSWKWGKILVNSNIQGRHGAGLILPGHDTYQLMFPVHTRNPTQIFPLLHFVNDCPPLLGLHRMSLFQLNAQVN